MSCFYSFYFNISSPSFLPKQTVQYFHEAVLEVFSEFHVTHTLNSSLYFLLCLLYVICIDCQCTTTYHQKLHHVHTVGKEPINYDCHVTHIFTYSSYFLQCFLWSIHWLSFYVYCGNNNLCNSFISCFRIILCCEFHAISILTYSL